MCLRHLVKRIAAAQGSRIGQLMAFGDLKSRQLSKLRVNNRTFVRNHELLTMLEEISHDCV
jgi:hypothetical protein